MKKYTRILISKEERLALEMSLHYIKDMYAKAILENLLERSKHKEK